MIDKWSKKIYLQSVALLKYLILLMMLSMSVEPKWSNRNSLLVPRVALKASSFSSCVVTQSGRCKGLLAAKDIKDRAVLLVLSSKNIKPTLSLVVPSIP